MCNASTNRLRGLASNAISAIIAVAGTFFGSALTYFFQRRTSERAEASAWQRELRAERMRASSSYSAARWLA
jgi:membrane protein YqaA with SNARE-associated domain